MLIVWEHLFKGEYKCLCTNANYIKMFYIIIETTVIWNRGKCLNLSVKVCHKHTKKTHSNKTTITGINN